MTDKMIYHCILALHNSQKRGVALISGLSKCSWNDFRKLSERDFKEMEQAAIELAENYKAIAEMLHRITEGDNTRAKYFSAVSGLIMASGCMDITFLDVNAVEPLGRLSQN